MLEMDNDNQDDHRKLSSHYARKSLKKILATPLTPNTNQDTTRGVGTGLDISKCSVKADVFQNNAGASGSAVISRLCR